MKWVAAVCLTIVLGGGTAFASASGFVYVLDPKTGCTTCFPEVLVFDASTTRLAARVLLDSASTPAGIVISRDGRYLYVSSVTGASSTMTVIDARRHARIAVYPTGIAAGLLDISGDGTSVYIRTGRNLHRFDTATHAVTSTTIGTGSGVTFNPRTGTVMASVFTPDGNVPSPITVHDPITLAEVGSTTLATTAGTPRLSAGGTQFYVVRGPLSFGQPYWLTTLDATSLTVVDERQIGLSILPVRPVHSAGRNTVYVAGTSIFAVNLESGSIDPIALPTTSLATGVAMAPSEAYLFATLATRDATGLTAVAAIDPATRTIVSTFPLPGPPGIEMITATPPAARSCDYRLDTAVAAFGSSASTPVPVRLTTECAWVAVNDAPWLHLSATSGTTGGIVTLTADPNVTGQNRSATISIGGQPLRVSQSTGDTIAPFGYIDTPVDGAAGLSGAVSFTGWAIDDIGVASVSIVRDPVAGEPGGLVPVGTATLVEGARPDVAALFADTPFVSRAGWGYQLLTNMLPGPPAAIHRFYIYATDLEGHSTLLGTRTVQIDNGSATLPFGAIDTPGQGETVSGVIVNWGWALTPPPGNIPADGSTIDVLIDGVAAGHPVFGLNRPDIASLFPGYANTNSAVGYFIIDTTLLSDGVHTIAWIVRDDLGRAQGIGSRYVTVRNGQ